MGFFDNAEGLLNRGVATAGRGTKAISLKAQIADLGRTRSNFMAQLGESLYADTRYLAELRSPRESLYSSIEGIDAQLASLQSELDMLEAQAKITASDAVLSARCPSCGRGLANGDEYCPGCGVHLSDVVPHCVSCGAVVGADHAFCMACGAPVEPLMDDYVDEEDAQVCEIDPEAKPVIASNFGEEFLPDSTSNSVEEPASEPVPNEVGVCPACGYHGSASAVFCRSCGLKL